MNNEPIILTHEQHINEIMRNFRLKRIDEISADVIYNEQLRAVAGAMYEPEPYRIDKAVAVIWSGYFAYVAFGVLLMWEMVR